MSQDNSFNTDIAVVGMAGRFAGARDLREYWANLRGGVESITRFTDEELIAAGVDPAQLTDPAYVKAGAVLPDMEQFDAAFFGFSPREAAIMDPQHRHFLECCWLALEDAGHLPEQFDGAIGVYAGSGHNAYLPYNLLSNPQLVRSVGFFLLRHTGNDKDFLTTRASYLLDLKGPSVNVQTACSTSLVAIHMGCQGLLNGECDMVLAGGVTIELPHRQGYLYQEGEILSPDGHCHAFDAGSQGTVFGSGVGIVVLRRLADALADGDHIHAVIKGSAINNDGSGKVGYLAPSVDGQAQAIAEALAVANVPADTITYVEAHGTGTPVGDPIEVAALTQAFRQSTDKTGFCGIGSVKSNIGHTDTAAGVASFMKVALAMQHGELPPTLHFAQPNPACEFERTPFYVNATLKPWQPPPGIPRRAGVSSLGVGGTNAHVVLEQAPPQAASAAPSREYQLLSLSARTTTALDGASAALAAHLRANPALNLSDVAHTLRVGRRAMAQRRVVVARDAADAAAVLAGADPLRLATLEGFDTPRKVAFMFAGGGAQHPGMGADLYRTESVFRAAVDECIALLRQHQGVDITPLLFPSAGEEAAAAKQLERPSLALPALFTIQRAQVLLWESWGVVPSACIGHSMGEYTAAHLAGVFSLADALTLVELRGRLFETLPEGAMLSVPLAVDQLEPLLGSQLSIAAINGPELCVASGPVHAVEALGETLAARDVDAIRVRIAVAAHSSMLEPILAEFGAVLRGVTMRAPQRPYVSNLSGMWITAAEATDPNYWVRHLRETVRFADGVRVLLEDEDCLLLEVGPGRTLASLARMHPARRATQAVLNGMRHPDDKVSDLATMLLALGRLAALGAPVDWGQIAGPARRRRLSLPGYCFDHQRHWIEPGKSAASVSGASEVDERSMGKRADIGQWFYQPVWRETQRPAALSDARGIQVLLFADACGLADQLAARLREGGARVATVRDGAAFERKGADTFTIDAASADDHERLIATLNAEARAPSRIVHLWAVTGPQRWPDGFAAVRECERKGFFSLMYLAQAIAREDLTGVIECTVVADRSQRVAADTDLEPAKALLLGACKVMPQEMPSLRCRTVDVQWPLPAVRHQVSLVDALLAEVAGLAGDGDVVAYRGGARWVQGFDSVSMPEAGAALRERGVYLVTGGFGGVGLALAEHLARAVRARLVLLGRHALPSRASWPAALSDATTPAVTAQRIRQIQQIEAAGGEVMPIAADVTDPAAMRKMIGQVQAHYGALHGVLHAAGVLDDGAIQLKSDAAARAVLAPKVQGTLALDAALRAAPSSMQPDFVALFSSISAFAGLAGQIDYAAANAYLDAFAQQRAAEPGPYTVAIDWSQWQEVGMAAVLAQQLGLAPAACLAIDEDVPGTPLGHPLVQRLIGGSLGAQGERTYQTRMSIATHWLLDEHRVRGGEALVPGTGYLELLRAVFEQELHDGALELRDITFLAPFVVHAGEERDLRVQVQPQRDGTALLHVLGAVAAAAGSEPHWVEHVSGRAAFVTTAAPVVDALHAVRARCTLRSQVFNGSEQPVHLKFGPRWGNLRRVDYGVGEALASLELPGAFTADLAQYALHPALMDMATAGAQALIPGFDEHEDFYVPASYGCVRVLAPLVPRVVSHIRLRADETQPGELAVFDITVMDADGRALVQIDRFTMLRVRNKALLADVQVANVSAARPRSTANKVLAVGQREGILTQEGADALMRVLAQSSAAQVVVSPQDLTALLAKLHAPVARAPAAQDVDADASGFKVPRTAIEKLIAGLWSELLGVARVGLEDNFFDLGGHSLLAVQAINKLKKRTGKPLALTALLEAPTVESLAALIDPEGSAAAAAAPATAATATPVRAASDVVTSKVPAKAEAPAPIVSAATEPMQANRTLITIRKGRGGRPPLFFVHDGLGETLLYRTLANLLPPEPAVYGLQPAQRADGSYIHTRIVEMAAAHLRQVRAAQPHGPYFLTGLCAGGVIAFEMARQLQDAGEPVAFVGIMDAADVKAAEWPMRHAKASLARIVGTLTENGSGSAIERIGKAIPKILRKTANFVGYQVSSRVERLRNTRKVERLRALAGRDHSESTAPAPDMAFLPMYEVAHRQHEPSGRLHGADMVVYRASHGDGSSADEAYVGIYSDPLLGWQPRVVGPVVAVDVPGGHTSLLQEPHVRVLAEAMQMHLERAWSAHGPATVPAGKGPLRAEALVVVE